MGVGFCSGRELVGTRERVKRSKCGNLFFGSKIAGAHPKGISLCPPEPAASRLPNSPFRRRCCRRGSASS